MFCDITSANISFIFAGEPEVLHNLFTRNSTNIQRKIEPRTVTGTATPIGIPSSDQMCKGRHHVSLNSGNSSFIKQSNFDIRYADRKQNFFLI